MRVLLLLKLENDSKEKTSFLMYNRSFQ